MGSTPSAPKYNQSADIAEQNRLNQAAGLQQYANVNGPLGSYSTSIDPATGQITVNKQLGASSQAAQNAQLAALSNYSGDPTEAANAYYNAQMAYLQPQLNRQVERAESSLTNRGLPLGSNAWNSAMGDIYDAQNRTLTALSNEALANGQQYQTNILNQAALAGGQVIDPAMVAGQAGAGLENTYDKLYQNQVDQYKTKMAKQNSLTSGLLGAVGTIGGAVLGGPIGAAIGGSLLGSASKAVTDVNGNYMGQVGGYGTYQG